MNKPCGLIGMPLGHSFSPMIHAMLADYEYKLFPLEEAELEPFLKSRVFHGINVTIPYKKTVVPYCDELSEAARHVGCVNTILCREDGSLYGHNTDYDGFLWLIRYSGADVRGKKAVVLGTGGASLTVLAVLHDLGVGEIINVSRTGEENYSNLHRHYDADILVNATPVGMYPDNGKAAVELRNFSCLKAVYDVVYNPYRTRLVLEAEHMGIPAYGGLGMLVAQARAAAEVFSGKRIDDGLTERIIRRISQNTRNVLLVGMPGSGKTTVGKELARILGREFFDSDEQIVRKAGCSIEDIFSSGGEAEFRRIEREVLEELTKLSGMVIATGGGAVTYPGNIDLMRQNSVVVWLRRDLGELPTDGRPLSKSNKVEELYRVREPLYREASDIIIENDLSPAETAEKIREALEA